MTYPQPDTLAAIAGLLFVLAFLLDSIRMKKEQEE